MRSPAPWRSAALLGLPVVLLTAFTGVAIASTTKGDPQPELKPFNIAAKSEAASTTAMLGNGSLVIAYYNSDTSTDVCVLPRAAKKCSHVVPIKSPGGNSEFGVPQVFAAGSYVGLMTYNTVSGELYYESTDGAATFHPAIPVGGGDFEADESTLAGPDVAFADNEDHDGVQVGSFSLATPASTDPVLISPTPAFDTSIGAYKGGVILADTPDNADKVTVWHAMDGANLSSAASYKVVGTFSSEDLIGLSGSALLTVQAKGKKQYRIRFFNGTSYGPAHTVPHVEGTIGNWGTVIQDPHGVTHVFDESNGSPGLSDYDLYEFSTVSGSSWSSTQNYGNAIKWTYFSGALDRNGSGAVVGGETPMRVWPVLQVAHVSFSLNHSSIKTGHSVKASGKGTPAASGRKVTLEKLGSHHLWHSVKTTHESASGKFSFTISGSSLGTAKYRAVTADKAGYVEYGYSSSRSLTVTA